MPENGFCCVGFDWDTPYLADRWRFWGQGGSTDWPCTIEYLASLQDPLGDTAGDYVYARWFPMRDWLIWGYYCGPEPRACCIDGRCYELSIPECYDAGGEAIPWWFGGHDWVKYCTHVVCGDPTWCCLEYADGSDRCRYADSVEQCEDISHWASNPIVTYVIPDGSSCQDICGKEIACCLSWGCVDTTWRDCEARGGEHSGTCLTCADEGPCCPIPTPCCLCGGECAQLFPQECERLDGFSVPGMANCLEAKTLCENIDLRPSCRSGSWMLVPSRTDSEQYELLSTAPIWIEDYAEGPKTQHHYAHVGVDPWLCHRWDEPRNLYEKSICGVALAEDGNLGGCIPEGHGGIICGWQPPCPELV